MEHAYRAQTHIQQSSESSDTAQNDKTTTSKKKRCWYYPSEDVIAARQFIKERYTLDTEDDAVNLALLVVAEAGGFRPKKLPAAAVKRALKKIKPEAG